MAEKLLTLIQDTTGDEIYPNIKEDNIPPSVRDKLQEIDGKQNQIIASTISPFSITVDNTGIDLHKITLNASGQLEVGEPVTQIPSDTYIQGELDNKQDTLVSGTNIKTLNGQSILGSGDLPISGQKFYEHTIYLYENTYQAKVSELSFSAILARKEPIPESTSFTQLIEILGMAGLQGQYFFSAKGKYEVATGEYAPIYYFLFDIQQNTLFEGYCHVKLSSDKTKIITDINFNTTNGNKIFTSRGSRVRKIV